MNDAPADSPAAGLAAPKPAGAGGWSRRRWLTLIALVFAAQVGFIFALGERHFAPPRIAAHVPALKLADNSDELIALDNPTLFALPNAGNFKSGFHLVAPPSPFRWTEAPQWLPPVAESFGAIFTRFMQTNRFAAPSLDFKPQPELSEPTLPVESAPAPDSTLQITGDLAQRRLLAEINLPSLPCGDVLRPGKVQALVDAAGSVISVALLESSGLELADSNALTIARTARFAPSSRLTVGQMIFNWRTVPPPATNSPASP
jgi:TonB family protein